MPTWTSAETECSLLAKTEPFTPAQLYSSFAVQEMAFITNIFILGNELPNKHYWLFFWECS